MGKAQNLATSVQSNNMSKIFALLFVTIFVAYGKDVSIEISLPLINIPSTSL